MIIERLNQQATPSVNFNFDYSNQVPFSLNQKTNQFGIDQQFISYDYSFSNIKVEQKCPKPFILKNEPTHEFATPSQQQKNIITSNLLETPINHRHFQNINQISVVNNKQDDCLVSAKLNTQEFFDQFDNNFVINFGDSPQKIQATQFAKTFESCPGINYKQANTSKVNSYISEPIARKLSAHANQNQEDVQTIHIQGKKDIKNSQSIKIQLQKQNQPPQNIRKKSSKLNCQIRKRVILKNNQKLLSKINTNKVLNQNKNSLIKRQNLLIVTSSNWLQRWTDVPKDKKGVPANSQPIKRGQKSMKKVQSNIFTSRQKFKQTLRSTTLDNWKKKFIVQKNQQKIKVHNIFQKPFSLLR